MNLCPHVTHATRNVVGIYGWIYLHNMSIIVEIMNFWKLQFESNQKYQNNSSMVCASSNANSQTNEMKSTTALRWDAQIATEFNWILQFSYIYVGELNCNTEWKWNENKWQQISSFKDTGVVRLHLLSFFHYFACLLISFQWSFNEALMYLRSRLAAVVLKFNVMNTSWFSIWIPICLNSRLQKH